VVDCQVKEESVLSYALLFYIIKGKITETKLHIFLRCQQTQFQSAVTVDWCYRLAFRISLIWSMARAPSMCIDIFHGFSSVPLDECQDSVLTVP
jgi:hypothetical protein